MTGQLSNLTWSFFTRKAKLIIDIFETFLTRIVERNELTDVTRLVGDDKKAT